MPNLFVSYDLARPEKNFAAMEKGIRALGPAVRALECVWYVKSRVGYEQAQSALTALADAEDKILVIDALSAAWDDLEPGAADFVQLQWTGA